MTRYLAILFALVAIADFAWLLVHWRLRPDMTRHAEYLGALAALLYAVARVASKRR